MRPRLSARPRSAATSPLARTFLRVEALEAREVLDAALGTGGSAGYVGQLYRDLLGREPDAGGQAGWVALLDQGVPTEQVVQGFVGSTEYRTREVQELYRSLLGRPADAGGLSWFVGQLGAGQTPEGVEAQILGSTEYFQKAGGTTEGFLTSLYADTLGPGRTIDPTGAAYWNSVLASGASRTDVARGVLTSDEGMAYTRQALAVQLTPATPLTTLPPVAPSHDGMVVALATSAAYQAKDSSHTTGSGPLNTSTGGSSSTTTTVPPTEVIIGPLPVAPGTPGEKVQVSDPTVAQQLLDQGASRIADYGSYQLLSVPSSALDSVTITPVVERHPEYNFILMNAGAVDTRTTARNSLGLGPKDGGPVVTTGPRSALVQFVGPVQPAWYEALVATGVRVVTPIPSNAYMVYGDDAALQRLGAWGAQTSYVQYVGDYLDAYRVDPMLVPAKGQDVPAPDAPAPITIQLVKDGDNAATMSLVHQWRVGDILSQDNVLNYHNVTLVVPYAAIFDVFAHQPDVVSIQPYVTPEMMDERQDLIIAGQLVGNAPNGAVDYLTYLASKGFTQAQFDASGFVVDVTDSGIDNGTTSPNHFGLYRLGNLADASRVVYNRLVGTPHTGSTIAGADGHGNLDAHIVGGYVPAGAPFDTFPHQDASGFQYGLGVAPFVKVGSSVIFDPNTFTSPNFENLQSMAYNDGARISTNSWGANVAGAYTSNSQRYDALVRDAQPTGSTFATAGNQEMVIVFSAGNAGPGAQTIGSPGSGKNVITVGAAENVHPFGGSDGSGISDTGANSANDMISFSSRGPTSDGRIKPEIVAPGTHVTGGVWQENPVLTPTGDSAPGYTGSGVSGGVGSIYFPSAGQQYYTASSGTSHSAPAVAGGAALIRQAFINQGQTPPSPAMTKASLMATARYLNGVGANDTLWSNSQGMGEMNLDTFFDVFSTASVIKDQSAANTFTASGQERIFIGNITSNARPLRVTLAWTDAPGPTSGNSFLNNLDLEVTVGGNTYKGNVFSGASSITGGSADIRNNAESVFLPAGVSGPIVIKVKATSIIANGVPNIGGALDQDFALMAYNVTETPVSVLNPDGSSITAESCTPASGALDPGETVTVSLALKNIGNLNTTSLVATLLATGGVTSPSAAQNYGVVVAGGASVSRSFNFTVNAACGDLVTATLQLQDGTTNLGTVNYSFRVGVPGPVITGNYNTGSINVPIPDLNTIEVPLTVSDVGLISDVNASVRLNHTFDGDLIISLVHPDGTVVTLSNRRGSSGDNFGTGANSAAGTPTVFDDEAGSAIASGVAPFVGSFRPDSPLSALDGKATNGTWKLRITDAAGADVGTVGYFALQIDRHRYVCCGDPIDLQTAGQALTAESFTPANNAADPGETVTMNFSLRNWGGTNTTNLVATLLSSGGVVLPSAPQSYGVVPAYNGGVVTRPFTFGVQGNCGDTITATLQLQDGATNLGTVTYTFQLGALTTVNWGPFANPGLITIPNSGVATPYPSTINVAGVAGTVSKVTATLTNMNHTFPDDIDILLVGPGGQSVILMSDAGGSPDLVNVTLTFDDTAVNILPDSTQITSGTYRPTNSGTGDTFPAPAPAAPYGSTLSVFNGVNPNGAWRLFVVDDASGDVGNIAGGWSLSITTLDRTCVTDSDLARVSAVSVGGTGWAGAAYTVPAGATQLRPLSWINANQISLTFTENVFVDQNDLAINGLNVGTYGVSNYAYDSLARKATWTLNSNITADKLTLTLDGTSANAVTDVSGKKLDGEWTNAAGSYPSGNGTEGGNFVFGVWVLPGDVNGDGLVNVNDVAIVRTRFLSGAADLFADVDHSGGAVTLADYNNVRTRQGNTLP